MQATQQQVGPGARSPSPNSLGEDEAAPLDSSSDTENEELETTSVGGPTGGNQGEARPTEKAAPLRISKRKEAACLRCTAEGCGKTFWKRACLQRHMLSHTDERQFSCRDCGAAFKRKEHLERHASLRHSKTTPSSSDAGDERGRKRDDQGPQPQSAHACDHCGKTFVLNYHLRRHLKTHMLLYKCQHCAEGFGRKRQLRRHMLLHLVARPSPRDADLTECKSTHSGASPPLAAKEPLAENGATDWGASAFEKSEERGINNCESKGDMAAEESHSSAQKLICPHNDCGKVFSSLEQLYRHLKRAAQRKRDYACAVCGASFSVFSALVAHKRSVHSSKVHTCEQCGKAYTRTDRLKAHVKAKHPSGGAVEAEDDFDACVEGGSAFHCSQCSLSFSSKSNLRVHVRVKHLNERRFSCSECHMTFAYKSVLRRHLSSVHGSRGPSGAPIPSSSPKHVERGIPHMQSTAPPLKQVNGGTPQSQNATTVNCDAARGEADAASLTCSPSGERGGASPTMASRSLHDPAEEALTETAVSAAPTEQQKRSSGKRFLVDAVSVNLVARENACRTL